MLSLSRRRSAKTVAVAIATSLLVLVGCSDVTGDGSGGSSLPEADPDKVYAEGVPTLNELYEGSFGTPPDSSPGGFADDDAKSVYWVACNSAIPACLEPGEAAKEAGKLLNVDVTILDGKYDAGGAWSTAIRTAIAADADGIILYGVSCGTIQQALAEAKTAEIPVMGTASTDCSDVGGEQMYTAPMVYSDGIENAVDWYYEMGANSARYVIDRSEGRANLVYDYNRSEATLDAADRGFRDVWELCDECEMLEAWEFAPSEQTAGGLWTDKLRTALVKNPDATAVFLGWDVEMSVLGGVQAVQEAGLRDAIVFGGEGVDDTFSLVRDGRVDALTKVSSRQWFGWASMDNMLRALKGQPAVQQGLGLVVVDQKHNLPDEGEPFLGPEGVDFKAQYTKIWEESAG